MSDQSRTASRSWRKHLRFSLRGLIVLVLVSTQITDAGLAHLNRLTSLSKLSLSHTQITDVGLLNLKNLTRLSVLDLRGTKVTDAGVNELQNASELQERSPPPHVCRPGSNTEVYS